MKGCLRPYAREANGGRMCRRIIAVKRHCTPGRLMSQNMSDPFKSRDEVKVSIRLATPSDALALARSRYSFRSSLGIPCEEEESFVERCCLWMQSRLGEQGSWRCWVAEREHAIVGNLWMHLIEKIPNPVIEPEHHAYVTNFYVREEERGRGIGSKLLEAALEWAKAQDVHAVILWPTQQSRPLYERHGFAVRDDLLELIIAGEERTIWAK